MGPAAAPRSRALVSAPFPTRGNCGELPPSGDSSISRMATQSIPLASLYQLPWRIEMLQVKSRIVVLAVVAAAAVAAVLGNYGWLVKHP